MIITIKWKETYKLSDANAIPHQNWMPCVNLIIILMWFDNAKRKYGVLDYLQFWKTTREIFSKKNDYFLVSHSFCCFKFCLKACRKQFHLTTKQAHLLRFWRGSLKDGKKVPLWRRWKSCILSMVFRYIYGWLEGGCKLLCQN